MMSEVDYSDLEFDEEKYYLGTLCKRNHDWNSTGCSLRYNNKSACGACVRCKEEHKLGVIIASDYVEHICLKCEYCGESIKLKKSVYLQRKEKGAKYTFCSTKCSAMYYGEKRRKRRKFCANCGEEYFNQNLKYCCKECANKGIEDKVVLICRVCGSEYSVSRSKAIRSKTCSVDCRIVYVTSKNKKSIYEEEDLEKRQLNIKRRSRIRRTHFKTALSKAESTTDERERREIRELVEAAIDYHIVVLDTNNLIQRRSNG